MQLFKNIITEAADHNIPKRNIINTNRWIDKKETENIQQAEASRMEQDKAVQGNKK